MNAFKKLDKQNSIANLHTYKKFTDKAPVLHEPSARRSIKLLWKHITGKRWGPGEMTFGPNNNTTFKQHEVHFDLNGGWKLLIWAMASQFHKPSYYLEGKAGVLSKYANDKNYFKRKLKRIKRRKKKSKRNTREQEARSLTYMNERLVQLNHNIDGG